MSRPHRFRSPEEPSRQSRHGSANVASPPHPATKTLRHSAVTTALIASYQVLTGCNLTNDKAPDVRRPARLGAAREAEEREAAEIDAIEEARELAAIERQKQIDADELADAQDAGDVDRFGRFIPYPRYP